MKKIQVGQCPECQEILYADVSPMDFTERFGPRQVIPIRAQCTQQHKSHLIFANHLRLQI